MFTQAKYIFVFFFLLLSLNIKAQFLYDTLYYTKSYDKAIWSVYQNYYNNSISLSQTFTKDSVKNSSLIVNAESLKEIGFSYSKNKVYTMVNLFGILPNEPARKPKPQYANCILSYSDRDYVFETGFNWFMGYYEKNSKNFIPDFNIESPYYDYGKLRTLNTYINYTHFTNSKKFSYNAAYKGTARQKKSAITALYYAATNYNRAESDSAIVPFYVRNSYGELGQMNRLYNAYFAVGAGFSGTLVAFKALFLNLTAMGGPGLQFQQYSLKTESGFNSRLNFLFYGDARIALGLNLKHFFISSNTSVNFKYYTIKKLSLANTFLSSNFSIGYRFNKKKSKYFH